MSDELPRNVTPKEDAILRAAAVRGGKIVSAGRLVTDDLPPPDVPAEPRFFPKSASTVGGFGPMYGALWGEAKVRAAIAAAVAKEREKCAKVCDGQAQIMESAAALADADDRPAMLSTAWKIRLCAAAIRAVS